MENSALRPDTTGTSTPSRRLRPEGAAGGAGPVPGAAAQEAAARSPGRGVSGVVGYAEEIGRGMAEVLVDVVWLPRSLREQRVDVLAAGLVAGLRAIELPDLPRPSGQARSTIDSGGIVDAVAGLLPSAPAALDAGRRIGTMLRDLLAWYPSSPTPAAAATATRGGGGGRRGAPATEPGDPDLDGPYTLNEAAENVQRQLSELARLYALPTLDAAEVLARLPWWVERNVAAMGLGIATERLQAAGVLLPSSALVGILVHEWLEKVYRFVYVGPQVRFNLPGPVRTVYSEVVQERRVYFPNRPSEQLSRLTRLSATFQTRVRIPPTAPLLGGPARYDALWVGLWSPRSLGGLKPDTLDFTRRRLWEIKPANRAPEAVAQLFQYLNGYNLAYSALTQGRHIPPDRHEARALSLGGPFAWPSLGPIPIVVSRALLFAVPFTLPPLPGLVSYVVVDGATVLAAMERLYERLRDAIRDALRRARQAAQKVREWLGDLVDDLGRLRPRWPPGWTLPDFEPVPAPAYLAHLMAILMAVAIVVVIITQPQVGLLLIVVIAAMLLSAQRRAGVPPGTVPVLTPEGGAGDETALLAPPARGAGTEAPVVTLDSPLGAVDLPAAAVPPLLATAGLWSRTVADAMTRAIVIAAEQVYRSTPPEGPPQPAQS